MRILTLLLVVCLEGACVRLGWGTLDRGSGDPADGPGWRPDATSIDIRPQSDAIVVDGSTPLDLAVEGPVKDGGPVLPPSVNTVAVTPPACLPTAQ